MALNDIILRESSHSPLTTKGSRLTFGELDQNLIELYDAAKLAEAFLAALGANIAPWDSSLTYYAGDEYYVSYGGNIYYFIGGGDSTNEQPDLNPTVWELSSTGAAIGFTAPKEFAANISLNIGVSAQFTSVNINTTGKTFTFSRVSTGVFRLTASATAFRINRPNYYAAFMFSGGLDNGTNDRLYPQPSVERISGTVLEFRFYQAAVAAGSALSVSLSDDPLYYNIDQYPLFYLRLFS